MSQFHRISMDFDMLSSEIYLRSKDQFTSSKAIYASKHPIKIENKTIIVST